ncbi:branched-chain amino acid transport system /permease component [bacterium BMS3Bbin02]|nr:branched-chain amino acid transport system /permease component [bacterium BMS3Bbin02]
MDLDLVTSILAIATFAGASLVLATIGEIFTERVGILNLGVEGMMIMGAVTGFAAAYRTNNVWFGVLIAGIVGGLMALVHAFATITLRADQIVSGLAITLLGTGLASFLGQILGPDGGALVGLTGPKFTKWPIPGLSSLPLVGEGLFNQDPIVYSLFVVVPVSWFFLYKTRPGLYLRAVGESASTSDAVGVDVFRRRYGYTVLGGVMAGIAGSHLSLSYTPGWTENLTGGRGWIVIALVIFATWNPARAVVGAWLFGGVNAIQFRLQAEGTNLPSSILNMSPYILTIVVLVLITRTDKLRQTIGAPAGLGIPYYREERG